MVSLPFHDHQEILNSRIVILLDYLIFKHKKSDHTKAYMMGIVKQFNLSEGDKLNWEIRAEGGELIINHCETIKNSKKMNFIK